MAKNVEEMLHDQLHSMQSYSFILGIRIEEAEPALKVEVQ